MNKFEDLCNIMNTLLSENGCSWDREQTHRSLRDGLLEEAYEACDAIDNNDMDNLREELGDLLMLVAFHGKIAEKENEFTISEIIDGICKKMISRHPHIFNDEISQTKMSPDETLVNWEKLKSVEKGYESITDSLRAVPRAFPSPMRAQKVQKRSEKSGDLLGTFDENIIELENAIKVLKSSQKASEEQKMEIIGEVLWKTVNISRNLKINADFALTNAVETFINRFEDIEKLDK